MGLMGGLTGGTGTALDGTAPDGMAPGDGIPGKAAAGPAVLPAAHQARPPAIETCVLPLFLAATLALLVATGPFLLSDAPAHLGMANYLLHRGDPGWPLLNRIYAAAPGFTPNLGGEMILLELMRLLPPLTADMALQAACVVSVPLAGWLVMRRIAPHAGWLALLLAPVGFQRMLYLGLYNFCLSTAGCLLCLWAWLGLREHPGPARAALLALCLLGTLACQVSGWLEAVAAIGGASLVTAIAARRSLPILGWTAAAVLPGALPFIRYLSHAAGTPVHYGASPLHRLAGVFWGTQLDTIGTATGLAAFALTLVVIVLAAYQVFALRRAWPRLAPGPRERALAILAMPAAFIAYLLIVPDSAGGAWTNMDRAQLFPFIGLVLLAGLAPLPLPLRAGSQLAGAASLLVILSAALRLQTVQAPPVLAEFQEADGLIGPHCTVVPAIFQYKLDPANSAQLVHHPMFHAASLLELHGDRAVLFNYLVRLANYPVRYPEGRDPQALLYHWTPGQTDTRAYLLDIPAFERATGIAVDYVLVWGPANADQQHLWDQLHDPASPHYALRDYRLIHHSAGGRLELFERATPGGCAKPPR
jgi:hypothetical protein